MAEHASGAGGSQATSLLPSEPESAVQRLPPELAALKTDQLLAQSCMGLVKGLQPQPYSFIRQIDGSTLNPL